MYQALGNVTGSVHDRDWYSVTYASLCERSNVAKYGQTCPKAKRALSTECPIDRPRWLPQVDREEDASLATCDIMLRDYSHYSKCLKYCIWTVSSCSDASRISQTGVGGGIGDNSKGGGANLSIDQVSPKLHENETNCTGGGHAFLVPHWIRQWVQINPHTGEVYFNKGTFVCSGS